MKELFEELRQELIYYPESGVFFWVHPKKGRPLDIEAGTTNIYGYRIITYNNHKISCNKLAWYFMTGEYPEFLIGPKDGNPSNLKWDNLIRTTRAEIQHAFRKKGEELNKKVIPSKPVKHATFSNKQVKEAVEEYIKLQELQRSAERS